MFWVGCFRRMVIPSCQCAISLLRKLRPSSSLHKQARILRFRQCVLISLANYWVDFIPFGGNFSRIVTNRINRR